MKSDSSYSTSRRGFLQASLLSSAAFGAPFVAADTGSRQSVENTGYAKNVIFMVSDGMNHGALSLGRIYRDRYGSGKNHWHSLYQERPVARALVETYSANSIVTDSAAAASAWGGGERVFNSRVNMREDLTPIRTLHEILQEKGWLTGLVSTATITHATPAGFAANVDHRKEEVRIAEQYLERQVNLLLGGGQKFFNEALCKKYEDAGYHVVQQRDDLLKLGTKDLKNVLGLFAKDHIPYTIDRDHDDALQREVPTLAEMTELATSRLRASGKPFFLLVEGARIDHAGHQNDAATLIHDQIAFDDAVGKALEFADADGETLVILTTDHGCGGVQMNGMDRLPNSKDKFGFYGASNQAFDYLAGFKHSFEWMKANGVSGLSGPVLGETLFQHTGIQLNEAEIKEAQGLRSAISSLYQRYHGIGWTSANHTADLVEFAAHGPGSHLFPAFLENRQVRSLVLQALSLEGDGVGQHVV